MSQTRFLEECDRISHGVDAVQYERLRWSKVEGPMLARLVELAKATMAERDDFELVEEGATSDIKRFVLKVHSTRVVGLVVWLDQGHALVQLEEVGRSRFAIAPGDPIVAEFSQVDATWMAAALQALFARILF